MPPDQPGQAAAWLIAEFDTTDPADITDSYDVEDNRWSRSVFVLPIIQLKDDLLFEEHFSAYMTVTQDDYAHPDGVLL